jgi:hypothetical protein
MPNVRARRQAAASVVGSPGVLIPKPAAQALLGIGWSEAGIQPFVAAIG